MVRGARADKTAQAAVHNFEVAVTAEEAAVDRSAYVCLDWRNSPLWRHRRERPKTLLFFFDEHSAAHGECLVEGWFRFHA